MAEGDVGQRYEIRCKGWKGRERNEETFGWTDVLSTAYNAVEAIRTHPWLCSPRVIDRQTGEEVPLPRINLH